MKDIQKVVDNEKWQELRESMKGTWTNEKNARENIKKLKKYVGNTKDMDKIRRVQNYLAALRGVDEKYPIIKRYRKQIKRRRKMIENG